jgi:G3E family GTPase
MSKLSDIVQGISYVCGAGVAQGGTVTVVDAKKCASYALNFGEIYIDQLASAGCIILSRTDTAAEGKIEESIACIRENNSGAAIITTPWDELTGAQIRAAIEREDSLEAMKHALSQDEAAEPCHVCGGHHLARAGHGRKNAGGHGHGCESGHLHDHGCGHGHLHAHGHEEPHAHGHEEQHGHSHGRVGHAENFACWGAETAKKFPEELLRTALASLPDENEFGTVLRAKGAVQGEGGIWQHFDYVPGEAELRQGAAATTGRICVIGTGLRETALARIFRL